ncbi:hypothetical protein ACA910_018935 [Epithemia clementina (nom. ined.)]
MLNNLLGSLSPHPKQLIQKQQQQQQQQQQQNQQAPWSSHRKKSQQARTPLSSLSLSVLAGRRRLTFAVHQEDDEEGQSSSGIIMDKKLKLAQQRYETSLMDLLEYLSDHGIVDDCFLEAMKATAIHSNNNEDPITTPSALLLDNEGLGSLHYSRSCINALKTLHAHHHLHDQRNGRFVHLNDSQTLALQSSSSSSRALSSSSSSSSSSSDRLLLIILKTMSTWEALGRFLSLIQHHMKRVSQRYAQLVHGVDDTTVPLKRRRRRAQQALGGSTAIPSRSTLAIMSEAVVTCQTQWMILHNQYKQHEAATAAAAALASQIRIVLQQQEQNEEGEQQHQKDKQPPQEYHLHYNKNTKLSKKYSSDEDDDDEDDDQDEEATPTTIAYNSTTIAYTRSMDSEDTTITATATIRHSSGSFDHDQDDEEEDEDYDNHSASTGSHSSCLEACRPHNAECKAE